MQKVENRGDFLTFSLIFFSKAFFFRFGSGRNPAFPAEWRAYGFALIKKPE
jgi:hypothetical protein